MSEPIPQPRGLPILGNLFDIKPSNTWQSLKNLAEQHGEIFKVNILGKTIVFVAGVDLAGEVCNEKRFRKYVGGPIVEIRYAVHDALFTAFHHEDSWGIAHRIIAPKLSPQTMTGHFAEMRDTAAEMIGKWKKNRIGASSRMTLVDELNRLSLEVTTLTLYGKKLNCLEGPMHPAIQGIENLTSEAVMRPTRPGFVNYLVYGNKFKRATVAMRSYAADLVEHRRQNPTDRDDVLTALMGHKDPETGVGLTDSQVIDEMVSMPIGSSTAPCLLATAVYYLIRNPDVVAKAREEMDRVIGTADFSSEHLPQLAYLEGIVRESLRLGHPAPGFNLEPVPDEGDTSPIQLAGGKYEIAHDQKVILVLAGVNRDPTYFEDPLAFKPERMMGARFDKLPKGASRWYGNGKRECIGKHFAWMWNAVTLGMLIRHVDFELVDPSYDLEKKGMDGWFNVRPIGFEVKARVKS
ncbi:Cytochrome P450 [Geosmithia morbida]|uniref:Cytochrome P450 n=1 Tax=Geosmithia morbida TaxID=1094350 RepID=A0A9P5D563_9HYPO|nr:Cytochrome P450 [Geosmithia morbida]KAF4122179.1 Cytochrome P450 [Geosmithia morbida]